MPSLSTSLISFTFDINWNSELTNFFTQSTRLKLPYRIHLTTMTRVICSILGISYYALLCDAASVTVAASDAMSHWRLTGIRTQSKGACATWRSISRKDGILGRQGLDFRRAVYGNSASCMRRLVDACFRDCGTGCCRWNGSTQRYRERVWDNRTASRVSKNLLFSITFERLPVIVWDEWIFGTRKLKM